MIIKRNKTQAIAYEQNNIIYIYLSIYIYKHFQRWGGSFCQDISFHLGFLNPPFPLSKKQRNDLGMMESEHLQNEIRALLKNPRKEISLIQSVPFY